MCFVIIIERLFWFLLGAMTQQSILHLVVNWEVFTINHMYKPWDAVWQGTVYFCSRLILKQFGRITDQNWTLRWVDVFFTLFLQWSHSNPCLQYDLNVVRQHCVYYEVANWSKKFSSSFVWKEKHTVMRRHDHWGYYRKATNVCPTLWQRNDWHRTTLNEEMRSVWLRGQCLASSRQCMVLPALPCYVACSRRAD